MVRLWYLKSMSKVKKKKQASYGYWQSPITANLVAQSANALSQIKIDNGCIYWLERRAEEGGRQVIRRVLPDGTIQTLTPSEFSVRTRGHEYGGGDYLIAKDVIYFCNDSDQRIYQQK